MGGDNLCRDPEDGFVGIASMFSNKVRFTLVAIEAVTASTAVGGGIALATGLEADRYPEEMLKGTPFRSYRIPGLMLASVVGGSATVAVAATLRRLSIAAPASILAGLVLMGWIAGEIRMLKQPASLGRLWEAGYFAAGFAMVALGLQLGRTKPQPTGLRRLNGGQE